MQLSALMYASRFGAIRAVSMLLAAGADALLLNIGGYNAFDQSYGSRAHRANRYILKKAMAEQQRNRQIQQQQVGCLQPSHVLNRSCGKHMHENQ